MMAQMSSNIPKGSARVVSFERPSFVNGMMLSHHQRYVHTLVRLKDQPDKSPSMFNHIPYVFCRMASTSQDDGLQNRPCMISLILLYFLFFLHFPIPPIIPLTKKRSTQPIFPRYRNLLVPNLPISQRFNLPPNPANVLRNVLFVVNPIKSIDEPDVPHQDDIIRDRSLMADEGEQVDGAEELSDPFEHDSLH